MRLRRMRVFSPQKTTSSDHNNGTKKSRHRTESGERGARDVENQG